MRSSKLWPAAALVVGIAVAACSSGSTSPMVPSAGPEPTTAAPQAAGSSSGATTALAKALAYSQCMRNHGMPGFPDPIPTPSGGYGFHLHGVNPQSPAFQSASQACNALVPGGWQATGRELSPAQQQQWLDWAKCVRAHGAPDFPDPTFSSGGEVHITGGGPGSPPQLQSAMDACKSQMPSTGGVGG